MTGFFQVPLADFNPEVILWLIIAFFWVLAQLSTLGKKKKKPGQRPPQRPAQPGPSRDPSPESTRPMEDELKEFLENLGIPTSPFDREEPVKETPPPRPPARPQPQPSRAPQQAPASAQQRARDRSSAALSGSRISSDIRKREQQIRATRQKARKALSRVGAGRSAAEEIEEAYSTGPRPVVKPESFLVGLEGLNLPILNVPLASSHATPRSAVRPPVEDRRRLQQAVVGQILLGTPKANPEAWQAF